MGEPGTSGESGGGGAAATSGASSSTSAAAAGASGVCRSAAELNLDPAVVASMTADELKKFIETGRTGRRNALPDVTEAGVITTTTAGVAEALESLSVGGKLFYVQVYFLSEINFICR